MTNFKKHLHGLAIDLQFVADSLRILSAWIKTNDREKAYKPFKNDIEPGATDTPLELARDILARVDYLHKYVDELARGKQ